MDGERASEVNIEATASKVEVEARSILTKGIQERGGEGRDG